MQINGRLQDVTAHRAQNVV